jgi:hypothetical protein
LIHPCFVFVVEMSPVQLIGVARLFGITILEMILLQVIFVVIFGFFASRDNGGIMWMMNRWR